MTEENKVVPFEMEILDWVNPDKIEELHLTERLNEISLIGTPKEFFEKDPHLTDIHFKRTQQLAARYMKNNNFDQAKFMDYLRNRLFFIELMYAQVYHSNVEIEPRPGQVLGSKLMTISHFFKGSFIGEYPTGSGKSFMYLIYASALYVLGEERTCIATAGINLQEQLDHKDLPFVASIYQSVTGSAFPYVLIKGRQNYACNVKLERIQGVIDARIQFAGIENQKAFTDYMNKIPRTGFDGDLSNIHAQLTPEVKDALTVRDSASGGCSRCESKQECYFYMRSKRAGSSAVVVINYHVFYTEFEKIKTPGFLSGGRPDTYVFDEAHEFSVIGRDFSERSFGSDTIKWMGAKFSHIEEMASDSMYKAFKLLSFSDFEGINTKAALEHLRKTHIAHSQKWLASITKYSKFSQTDVILNSGEWLNTQPVLDSMERLKDCLEGVTNGLVRLLGYSEVSQIQAVDEDNPGKYADELRVLNAIGELTENLKEYKLLLKDFMDPYRNDAKEVFWLSIDGEDIYTKSKKTEIETLLQILKESSDRISTVSVSATLAVNSSFSFYKASVNIPEEFVSFEVIGESPFDLKTQELWYLPEGALSGKDASKDYDDYVADRVTELVSISNGGALVLFTSKRSMDYVYGLVSNRLKHMTIYKQGESSKKILLDLFTKDVDSVLFANRSFFTGIDVKGESLRLIILDKLPFENPTDPVSRTLSNKPGGFKNYAIPTMVTTLKQIVGRGIRSRSDKCVIAFMDNRLKTANYASLVRATFSVGGNRSSRTEKLEEVIDFMSAYTTKQEVIKASEVDLWDTDSSDIPFKAIDFSKLNNKTF